MSSFMCDVCSLILNSQDQLTQHWVGKSHQKKLKAAGLSINGTPLVEENNVNVQAPVQHVQEPSNSISGKKRKSSGDTEAGMCSLCTVVFNSSVQAQQHYSGSKHFKKMKIVQGEGEITVPQEGNVPCQSGRSGMLFCGFCKVQVNSMEQLEIHRQGTRHQKNFEKMKSTPVTYPGQKMKSTPVTYPGQFVKAALDPTTIKAEDVPKSLPSFQSYLSAPFVPAKSTEPTMPSFDSYLKG